MCFRPPGAANAVQCPSCGMRNQPTVEKCKKCGADMTKTKDVTSEK